MTHDSQAAVRAAIEALVAALVAAVHAEVTPSAEVPERLLSIDEAARMLGIGRSRLYEEIGSGRCRSLKVGRRRLVPSSAISDYVRRGADK
jgi:excisionase family DNA binding protein